MTLKMKLRMLNIFSSLVSSTS